jgi:hypothetical protein
VSLPNNYVREALEKWNFMFALIFPNETARHADIVFGGFLRRRRRTTNIS